MTCTADRLITNRQTHEEHIWCIWHHGFLWTSAILYHGQALNLLLIYIRSIHFPSIFHPFSIHFPSIFHPFSRSKRPLLNPTLPYFSMAPQPSPMPEHLVKVPHLGGFRRKKRQPQRFREERWTPSLLAKFYHYFLGKPAKKKYIYIYI